MRIDDLPGELILWILIASEVLVFAAGLSAMVAMGLRDPQGFAAAQQELNLSTSAISTYMSQLESQLGLRQIGIVVQFAVRRIRRLVRAVATGGDQVARVVRAKLEDAAAVGIIKLPVVELAELGATFDRRLSGYHCDGCSDWWTTVNRTDYNSCFSPWGWCCGKRIETGQAFAGVLNARAIR